MEVFAVVVSDLPISSTQVVSQSGDACDAKIAGYLAYLQRERKRTQNTVLSYKSDMFQFQTWLAANHADPFSWDMIDEAEIQRYLASLQGRYRESSIQRKQACLQTFFRYLKQEGVIGQNPCAALKSARVMYSPVQPLSPSAAQALLRQPFVLRKNPYAIRDAAMLDLLLHAGLKTSELLELTLADYVPIDAETDGIRVPLRVVPLPPQSRTLLLNYIVQWRPNLLRNTSEQLLFLSLHGHLMTRGGFWGVFRRYRDAAGLPPAVCAQTLRHSFMAQLLQEKRSIAEIAYLLGHRASETTLRYVNRLADPINV